MAQKKASNIEFAFSAGGIVQEKDRVLLIKTKDLKGEIVWTFPKGHVERRERSADAALREVREETGYDCKIIKEIENVQYWFRQKGKLVKKRVKWFLMRPVEKRGEHDEEIMEIKWVQLKEAQEMLSYESDRNIVKKLNG